MDGSKRGRIQRLRGSEWQLAMTTPRSLARLRKGRPKQALRGPGHLRGNSQQAEAISRDVRRQLWASQTD